MTATSAPVRSALLLTSTYLFPALGFPLVTYAWWRASDGLWPFVAVVMGAPVVFGYVMPYVLTSVVKRWRFTSGPRLGSYYVHHGFIYGSKLALALLIVIRSLDTIVSPFDVAAVVLVTGAATAFGGWWHDAQAIKAGKIAIDDGLEGLSGFAPPSYFAMGATYAAVALASYRVLATDPAALPWVFPAALATLCAIPTLVFLAVDPPTRRILHALLARRRSPFDTGGLR
jgi:hypothetical protein